MREEPHGLAGCSIGNMNATQFSALLGEAFAMGFNRIEQRQEERSTGERAALV